MPRFTYSLLTLCLASFYAAGVGAAEPTDAENTSITATEDRLALLDDANTSSSSVGTDMAISRITVSGQRHSLVNAEDIIGSVDVLGADQVEQESVDMTLELLRKIPGVQYARFNQGVTSSNIALRGFNAEGEIHSTKLLIDGIPAHRNNGSHEMDALFPLEISRIDVVKGSSDPRYGQHNLAGNINVITRQQLDETLVRVLYGSFDTKEIQLATGLQQENFSQSYFAGWRESEGYRDHAGVDRHSLAGKWWLSADDQRWRFGVVARDYHLEADAPGYLSEQENEDDRQQSPVFSRTDGGDKDVQHLSVHLDGDLTETLSTQVKIYRQDIDFNRYVRFTVGESQQQRLENEQETGALLTAKWTPNWAFDGVASFSFGLDHQKQEVLNQRYRTIDRIQQGGPTRNQDYWLENTGGFFQANIQLDNRWQFQAGVRADKLDGEFVNRLNQRTAAINDYGTLIQPKFGILYGDNTSWNVYANWGRGFQIGYGAGAYRTQDEDLDASINTGYELGTRIQWTPDITSRLALWQQKATDEVRLKFDNSGDSENIGETERTGLDLVVTARLSEHFWLWGAYTRQQALLTNPGPRDAAYTDNDLHHIPKHIGSVGLDWRPHDKWQFSTSYQYQSDYELNNANDAGQYGEQRHLNAEVLWHDSAVTWGLHLRNLLDDSNNYVWLDATGPKFAAGDGRSAYLSAAIEF